MVYKLTEQQKQTSTNKILLKIKKNNHHFISGFYENQFSELIIFCLKHKLKHTTTFANYLRSKTGIPCCTKEQVKKKLQNRIFSDQTIAKMHKSALKRPLRNGKPRQWRKTKQYTNWRTKVFQLYNHKCAITHLTSLDTPLVAHHLISVHTNFDLCYKPENGIVITAQLHKKFHDDYGYKHSTIEYFCCFLLKLLKPDQNSNYLFMPISSQAILEKIEGSETKAYDPDRIMKLHERLEKLSQTLV